MNPLFIIWTPVLLLLLSGCREGEQTPQPAPEPVQQPVALSNQPGCTGCHDGMQLDANHAFACTRCHRGDNATADPENAHQGLIATPAAPEHMEQSCGECHADQIHSCANSLHYTLKNEVNLIRAHFGIEPELAALTEIPSSPNVPQNKQELVEDMLRRRCLRCHVYTRGDSYPYVQRGTGCAACHLRFTDGDLDSHAFTLPGQHQCLSCHYANHVGADFVGWYEHDFNWEYRTPYTTTEPFIRPYGVELHQLTPDIHNQRGLTCLDCHRREHDQDGKDRISCLSCHAPDLGVPLPDNVKLNNGQLFLTSALDGKQHPIPGLVHPAHEKYGGRVACQVCHGQWGFNDHSSHLLLSYSDEIDAWERLTVQSSSEVEIFLEHNLYSMEDELETGMRDSISGQWKPGIWYKGFGRRRWESILIDRDRDGVIKVFRPILDLSLSGVDEDGELLFDNVRGSSRGLLPYTPHTTGPAGLFYEQRFSHLLDRPESERP